MIIVAWMVYHPEPIANSLRLAHRHRPWDVHRYGIDLEIVFGEAEAVAGWVMWGVGGLIHDSAGVHICAGMIGSGGIHSLSGRGAVNHLSLISAVSKPADTQLQCFTTGVVLLTDCSSGFTVHTVCGYYTRLGLFTILHL